MFSKNDAKIKLSGIGSIADITDKILYLTFFFNSRKYCKNLNNIYIIISTAKINVTIPKYKVCVDNIKIFDSIINAYPIIKKNI